jgi:hypothetical protein
MYTLQCDLSSLSIKSSLEWPEVYFCYLTLWNVFFIIVGFLSIFGSS